MITIRNHTKAPVNKALGTWVASPIYRALMGVKQAKSKLKDYKIPVIPNSYFIELKEGNTRINIKIKGEVETAINADGPIINDYSIALLLKKIDNGDIV